MTTPSSAVEGSPRMDDVAGQVSTIGKWKLKVVRGESRSKLGLVGGICKFRGLNMIYIPLFVGLITSSVIFAVSYVIQIGSH